MRKGLFSQARIEWTKNYILMYSCSHSLQIHVHPPLVSPHPLKKKQHYCPFDIHVQFTQLIQGAYHNFTDVK